jgi:hypothetical protein
MYHITSIDLLKEVIIQIVALLRAYLWEGCDKVSRGKCKVNWEKVFRLTKLGCLAILHLEKFATALRLRWIWMEWVDES